jgi:hypothetical protein
MKDFTHEGKIKCEIQRLLGMSSLCDTIFSTTDLQLDCLDLFLSKLGYIFVWEQEAWHIINDDPDNGNPMYMSFKTALQLYNGCLMKKRNNWVSTMDDQFYFTEEEMIAARDSKFIRKIKLQRVKDCDEGIKCTSHLVEFTNKAKEV